MLKQMRSTSFVRAIVAACLFSFMLQPVQAVVISSADLVQEQQLVIDKQRLLLSLEREEVKAALVSKGVDPDRARERVASLTQEEVQLLNQQMEEMPAGGVLGVILAILLILLLTDIAGWTDVYPGVGPGSR